MITIRNAEALAGKVRAVFSPFFETCQALGVMEDPAPHINQAEWVRNHLGLLDGGIGTSFRALQARLGTYRMLDEAFDLPSEQFDASGQGEDLAGYLGRTCWSTHQFSFEPDVYDQIRALLLPFWEQAMVPFLAPRRAELARLLEKDRQMIEARGASAYLCSLSPRIRKKGRGGTDLVIEKKLELEIDAAELTELRVYASYFSAPFLVVAGDLDTQPISFFSICRELEREDVPRARTSEGVAALAFALSDSTRLRMLMMMTKGPVTQKALGDMMGLAKSTVSRHVSILFEAGILERTDSEAGDAGLALRLDRITTLSGDILSLLGMDRNGSRLPR